ncbi:TonB-dependent receptor family protein [Hymenobacter sp. BT175]|uniref:TonB-dependent receptor domain-containing protein n=1 Tax=Hymenobacter translucens TaxID=2886507 RepID=UPI001D0EF6E4|nr:TonB-dependent receptor [Hymenobacter translucens]MCC2548610.1 TonB-dependent receptor family protein [Hymenobacter translucens]
MKIFSAQPLAHVLTAGSKKARNAHFLPLLALAAILTTEAAAQAPAAPASRPAGGPAGSPTGATGGAAVPPVLNTLPAPRGNGRISGVVLDGATKKPVEFATVALLPASGEKPVDGTVADGKGRFTLKGLAPGAYRLQFSFLGYSTVTQPVVTLADSQMLVDLGSVELKATAQKLNEVTVTGERPMVESKPDRLVYNAAQDASNQGGTAADVLRKAPMVSVDPDGNLQLRGSGNVTILINGKPSAVVAGDVATALKQLPADQIKSVEVITSPSARYDGEGSAGIINIVLKENNLQGVNGSAGLALGTRNSNANVTLNVRRGRLGLNAALNGGAFYAPRALEASRVDRDVLTVVNGQSLRTTGRLFQRNDARGMGIGSQGRIGLEYEPAPNHALSLTFSSALLTNRFDIDVHNRYTLDQGQPTTAHPLFGNYTREQVVSNAVRTYDLMGAYTRSFGAKSRREWTVLAQHSRNRRHAEYDVTQFPLQNPDFNNPQYREQSPSLARNLETTLQTDYVHPLGEKQTVEVGAKMIQRLVFSDYEVFRTNLGTGAYGLEPGLTNKFDYDQDVLAGYATYGTSLGKKYSARLGARVERTDLRGNFQNQESEFRVGYSNVLPNLALTRTLRQPGSSLRATYSRRIQRPSIFYLNPYRNESDPRSIQQGNPRLDAEFTDNYELNWSTFVKGASINVSGYARLTNNAIEQVYTTDKSGRVLSTFGNVARNQTYGLNLFASAKHLPKWNISGNLSAYYVYLSSPVLNTSNRGMVYSANLNTGYQLGRGFSARVFAMVNSPRIQLQGRNSPWQTYSLSLRKDLWKGKGDLTMNADNLLNRYVRLANTFENGQSMSANTTYVYNRGVRVAVAYRFGKVENKPSRPKRSIRNDDQKAGEGETDQGSN